MERRKRQKSVDLLETIEILFQHLTEALCQEVFQRNRHRERERAWALWHLIQFWTAVILRAPQSLTQALSEASGNSETLWPKVETSPQAFFARCQDLSWTFFKAVYNAFTPLALEKEKPCYEASLQGLLARFPGIWAVDSTNLDRITRRLKILWKEKSVILPGCLTVFYDIFYGVARVVEYNADAAASEIKRATALLDSLPRGILLLGDRLYCAMPFFLELTLRGQFGVFRMNKALGWKAIRVLSRIVYEDGCLEDILVTAGSGQKTPAQTLRYIRWKKDGKVKRDVMTNVLSPKQLNAVEAIRLYTRRWKIERMFFDLKEVLNLHCFYAGNINAIGMQVYAAALVYNAMRIAQGHIARQADLQPEEISTARLFPRVAASSFQWASAEMHFIQVCRANPDCSLRKPDWRNLPFAKAKVKDILVQHRKGPRHKWRYSKARNQWKSLARVVNLKS